MIEISNPGHWFTMPIVKALIKKRDSFASTATNSVLDGTNSIASNGKRPRFKVKLASKMELDSSIDCERRVAEVVSS